VLLVPSPSHLAIRPSGRAIIASGLTAGVFLSALPDVQLWWCVCPHGVLQAACNTLCCTDASVSAAAYLEALSSDQHPRNSGHHLHHMVNELCMSTVLHCTALYCMSTVLYCLRLRLTVASCTSSHLQAAGCNHPEHDPAASLLSACLTSCQLSHQTAYLNTTQRDQQI
jgi:hypothetical protein